MRTTVDDINYTTQAAVQADIDDSSWMTCKRSPISIQIFYYHPSNPLTSSDCQYPCVRYTYRTAVSQRLKAGRILSSSGLISPLGCLVANTIQTRVTPLPLLPGDSFVQVLARLFMTSRHRLRRHTGPGKSPSLKASQISFSCNRNAWSVQQMMRVWTCGRTRHDAQQLTITMYLALSKLE